MDLLLVLFPSKHWLLREDISSVTEGSGQHLEKADDIEQRFRRRSSQEAEGVITECSTGKFNTCHLGNLLTA